MADFTPNVVTLVHALVAVGAPGATFFLAYGRFDGHFRDTVVFLYFIGGLALGGLLGFLTLLAFTARATLLAILLVALLYPIALVAGANRRKWQGERHAIFNGGALGLGAAAMIGFAFLYYLFPAITVTSVGQGALIATGLAGLGLALGLLAGDGVRRRRRWGVGLTGVAIVLAPAVFLEEIVAARLAGDPTTWLMPVLLAVYGGVAGIAAERRILPQGLTDDARRARRRKQRAGM